MTILYRNRSLPFSRVLSKRIRYKGQVRERVRGKQNSKNQNVYTLELDTEKKKESTRYNHVKTR